AGSAAARSMAGAGAIDAISGLARRICHRKRQEAHAPRSPVHEPTAYWTVLSTTTLSGTRVASPSTYPPRVSRGQTSQAAPRRPPTAAQRPYDTFERAT